MTYRELLYEATRLINNNEITLNEYEEMTKPLNREVEQEPCEDAISRQAVEQIIKSIFADYEWEYDRLLEQVKSLPPVNPTRPKEDFRKIWDRI